MSKNKSKQTKEIKLTSPVWFLNQIFKLGITQGIERRWGSLFTCASPPSTRAPQSSTTLPYHPTLRKSISLVRRHNKRNKIKWRMDKNWAYKNESPNPKSFKLKRGYSDQRSCRKCVTKMWRARLIELACVSHFCYVKSMTSRVNQLCRVT